MTDDRDSRPSAGKLRRAPAKKARLGSKGHASSAAPDEERSHRLVELGARIALARQAKGWTQLELGQKLGKSRGTIFLYEQGKVEPPLSQVESLAKIVDVSPEYLAFGRQGITGLPESASGVVSVPEIAPAKSEDGFSGAYGLTESLVSDFGIDRENARVIILTHAAPAFGLAKGDRVIVNLSDMLDEEDQLYALRTRRGIDIVRLLPNLSSREGAVKINDGRGDTHSYERRDLEVLGRVVGFIRAA